MIFDTWGSEAPNSTGAYTEKWIKDTLESTPQKMKEEKSEMYWKVNLRLKWSAQTGIN